MKWAVFLSGRGSNAETFFEMAEMDVRLCVSSKKSALGLARARRNGIPAMVLDKNPDWQNLNAELRERRISHIFLLGFMKLLPASFVSQWKGRIFNLHPSLLPLYLGKDSIERSYQDGAAMGVTIHEVVAEMDAGKILLQAKVFTPSVDQRSGGKHSFSLETAQQMISRTEQRLVRECVQNIQGRWAWNSNQM